MPRTPNRTRHAAILVAVIGLLAGCGGDSSAGDDEPTTDDSAYEILTSGCDPIRGAGTIVNRSGETAAFRVTVAYEYNGEELPLLESEATPALADDEEFEFSVGPDPTQGSPSSCQIFGAERIAVDEVEEVAVAEREEVAPDGELDMVTIAPAWSAEGINGVIETVAANESVGYMASSLSQGGAVFAVDLASGDLLWEIESDVRFDRLVPDGSGGVLAASGNLLVSFDEAGDTRWETVPLRRTEGVPAGSIDQIAIGDDVAFVGGGAPAAVAAIDVGSGDQLWHLAADEALATDPTGFNGGADLVEVTDHGVLVSGGVPSRRSLALLDVSQNPPVVQWSLPEVGSNASTDGAVVVDAADARVTAWDVATGSELWSASEDAWDRAPAAGAPAIIDDVVIVQRARSTIAFDLLTGEQRWEDVEMPTYWSFLGSDLRHGDNVFGQVSTTSYVTMGTDGSITEIAVDADIRGTVAGAAVQDDTVLLAAHGSTRAQGSTAFALDLSGVR